MIIYLIGFIVFGISGLCERESLYEIADEAGCESGLLIELVLLLVVIFWPLVLIHNILILVNLVKS